ncbi:MAG: hypothetical protein KGI54_08700 [Pseudomonadota bacterium]|nr:hypothetical protein [Pseudomonadota bacterium]
MPFNGSGTFNVYTPGNPISNGQTSDATLFNNTISDLASGLSNTLTKDGQTPATANIPMGAHKITGLAAGTTSGDAVRFDEAITTANISTQVVASVTGQTATGTSLIQAASAAAARTTLGSTTVGDALFVTASASAARSTLGVTTDNAEISVTAASTTDIGAAASSNILITGNTTITNLGAVAAGTVRIVRFSGTPILTYNATSLILPGSANITVAVGDCAQLESLGSGNWVCRSYQRFTGQSLISGMIRTSDVTPVPNNAVGVGITASHAFGVVPSYAVLEYLCLTAEQGYSVGDVAILNSQWNGTSSNSLNLWKSTTQVGAQPSGSTVFMLAHKTTGAAFTPTAANWASRFVLAA